MEGKKWGELGGGGRGRGREGEGKVGATEGGNGGGQWEG
jgi:hypothetical protein